MTEQSLPVIEIAPTSGWRALDLREIWQYRELLQILTWRDIKVRYRQTLLGVIWVVAQPLMTMIIFTLLFNRVAKISADHGLPYSLFVMAALVPWTFFSTAVTASGNSLIGSAHLISKVYFPRMIIPASSVLAGLVDMAVTLGLVLVMYVWYSVPLSWSLLIVPLPIVVTAVLAFGFGLWLSALNVEYRDVRVVIPFVLQMWMYATPIVYPLKALPLKCHWIVRVNPVTGIVDAFRACLLGQPLPWTSLAYAAVFGLIVMITGAFYFRRVERLFADVL